MNLAAFDTGSSATSFVATGVPMGTYYLRVRAKSACGASVPSNEVVSVVAGLSSGDAIEFVSSVPPPGGVIRTGLANPAVTLASGATTGLTITFRVTSGIDRDARLRLNLSGPAAGICLQNTAPVPLVPLPDVIRFRAGVPVDVTIDRLQMTSVCRYPYAVTMAVVSLIPPLGNPATAAALYQTIIGLGYTVVQ